jgi:hypothetical protein
MALVAYTNSNEHPVHIDGKTIMPGESRQVDETQVPGYGANIKTSADLAEPNHPEEPNTLAEILLGNVPSILSALSDLTIEQLRELENLETDAAQPRKGVLEAIDKRRLDLAQAEIK